MDPLLRIGLLGGAISTAFAALCGLFLPRRLYWLGIAAGSVGVVGYFVTDYLRTPSYEGSLTGVILAGVVPVLLAGWIMRAPETDEAGPWTRIGVSWVASGLALVILTSLAYLMV